MANKIIKYNLEANGTIPTYIDDGGYYPKANENASPQDWDLIGATTDGASSTGVGELVSKAAIESYLDSYTGDWTEDDPDNPQGPQRAFSQADAATRLWAKKIS
jgi:hypothetical protein